MEINNVTIEIQDSSMTDLTQSIYELIEDKISDDVENVLDEKLDDKVESHVKHFLDYEFDITEHIDNVDYNEIAQGLLEQYNPHSNCSTGEAFTEALEKGIKYLLSNNHEFQRIVRETVLQDVMTHFVQSRIVETIQFQIQETFNTFMANAKLDAKAIVRSVLLESLNEKTF